MKELGHFTSSSDTLAAMIGAGITAATLWVTQPQVMAADLTIPATMELRFVVGGSIKPNGHVVTANCMWNAPPVQCIDLSGGGSLLFTSNAIQKTYLFDWWGPSTGSADIGPLLNTITQSTPDYSDLVWMNVSNAGGGTTFNIQTTWQPKNCTSRTWRAAGQRNYENSVVALNYVGAAGAHAVIDLECCGHCLLQGFGMNTGGADYGILIDGQSGVSGGTRISTQNTLRWNIVYNSGNRATFKGIAIAVTSPSNNEFMEIIQNQVISTGTAIAGIGTGFYLGGSSNAHGHLVDHNSCTGCQFGYDAGWTGYYAIKPNFTANQTDIRINHVSYSTVIENADSENSGTFLDIGTVTNGGEAPVSIRSARLASVGLPALTPVFKFGPYIGAITLESCSFDTRYATGGPYPTLFQINSTVTLGGFIRFKGNNYLNWVNGAGTMIPSTVFSFTAAAGGNSPVVMDFNGDGLHMAMDAHQISAPLAPDANGLITPTAPIQYVQGGGNALQKIAPIGPTWGAAARLGQTQVIIAIGANLTITNNAAPTGMLLAGTLASGKAAVLVYDPSIGNWVGTY